MAEFNLIDVPWIPCIDLQGNRVEHGIKDTLLKAHELREIVDDSPLVTVALHRLLFAILYRAFEGPTGMAAWRGLWDAKKLASDGPVTTYLDKWRDRFFLFHDTHPFMQVAGLDLDEYKANDNLKEDKPNDNLKEYKPNGNLKTDKPSPMMRLAKEAPDASGRVLFDHRTGTERPDYEPKQIAKMILSAQNYAGTGVASGGKVGTDEIKPTPCSFAPCVDGLILWLQGENLFETLMLNLVPQEVCQGDLPAWEDDHIVQSAISSWTNATAFTGPCQRFAPLSRFVKAIDKKSIFFTNGLKASADANDPMKAYSRSSDTDEFKAIKLREEKAAWREAHTLMAVGRGNHKPPECLNFAARLAASGNNGLTLKANVAGMATNKDKAFLWRHERMPVPVALLNDVNLIGRLGGLLQNAEQAASQLWCRTKRVATLYLSPTAEDPDGRKPDNKDIKKMAQNLDPRPAYWARLERHFFDLLKNLPNDWDTEAGGWKPDEEQKATIEWRKQVKSEAKQALEESICQLGTTARAIQAVARVRTDFNDDDLKPPAQKQAKAKGKGGKQKK